MDRKQPLWDAMWTRQNDVNDVDLSDSDNKTILE